MSLPWKRKLLKEQPAFHCDGCFLRLEVSGKFQIKDFHHSKISDLTKASKIR